MNQDQAKGPQMTDRISDERLAQNAICQALLNAFPMADKIADNYAAVAVKAMSGLQHLRSPVTATMTLEYVALWAEREASEWRRLAGRAALNGFAAKLCAAALVSAEQHPDDLAVDRFAAAMKAKLAKKRNEGRGGWERKDECSAEFLSRLLREHVEKGDPLDVGNLAMMLHQRGETVAPTPGGDNRVVGWLMESDGAEPILTSDPANAQYGRVQGWSVRALAPLSSLEAAERENETLNREANSKQADLDHVSAAIGSVRWMDPPDGGNTSLGEQVNRMRQDLETAEASIAAAREALTNIRELNMSGADENGHRWANSDLIDQAIMCGLTAQQPGDDDMKTLQIAQTCWYWTKGADKPLAAIVVDFQAGLATLSVMTATGGRFLEAAVQARSEPGGAGWSGIGEGIVG